MSLHDEVIHECGDFRVRAVTGTWSDDVVITFSPWRTQQGLDVEAFGQKYLHRIGVDALHITCARNDWYQNPAMGAVCAAVNQAVAGRYARRIGYGSSMGAFAALAFSKPLMLGQVIAISPQFSIAPEVVPFETRWQREAAGLQWPFPLAQGLSQEAEIVVLYDPHHPDARHVELLRACRPVTEMRLPFSGHPSGDFLQQAGLISDVIAALVLDRADPRQFRGAIRHGRRRSPAYWFALSRALSARGRLPQAYAAMSQAAALAPRKPDYLHALGHLALNLQAYDVAAESFRAVTQLWPERAVCHYNLARALLQAGRAEEAVEAARLAVAIEPEAPRYVTLLDRLDAEAGRAS